MMPRRNLRCHIMLLLGCVALLFYGCSPGDANNSSAAKPSTDSNSSSLRDNTPRCLIPEAPGKVTYGNTYGTIDASCCENGYIMFQYYGTNEKVKFQIRMPDQTTCTYLVTDKNSYTTYPLSGGSGDYTFYVLESISSKSDAYAIAFTQTVSVTLTNDKLPFLYPNHYVNFTPDSALVAKARELASGSTCDLDVVEQIYSYVITNITYDHKKARNVAYGYTPNPDETLASGEGICFDYASLMSGMLRSQGIPTRLVVGYAGETYHAWISCYVDEIGWVDDIIQFDGSSWTMMDPTLAASNAKNKVKDYLQDESHYHIKYLY